MLLIFMMLSVATAGYGQGQAPKCDPDEINFSDVDPDDIYYQVLKKACDFMGNEKYDSVRYYLEYAYSIKPSASFPATKRKELKEFLGEEEYNTKPRYAEGQVPDIAIVEAKQAEKGVEEGSEEALEAEEADMTLSETQKEEFKEKASRKAKDFGSYIAQIADKSTSLPDINNAIELTIKLFVNENSMVQVSSKNTPDKANYKIRKYLNRLSELNYSNVKIETYDYYYASDFRLSPDGNYYATISFAQKFTGYNKEGLPAYEDVTKKNITVVLKRFQKTVEGALQDVWDVYLNDVSVSQTN